MFKYSLGLGDVSYLALAHAEVEVSYQHHL